VHATTDLAISGGSRSTPSVRSSPAADVFAFLLELGKALLATGDAVSDIELRLVQAAKAYGQPDTRVMVLPTAVAIAGGPRQPATLATVDTDGSLGSAGPQLRLDQITEVLHIARAAAAGEMSVDRGLAALGRVREMPSRYNPLVTILGYVVVTLGIGLILEPSVPLLPVYGALGLLVAFLRDGATRVSGLATILPVLAAGTVSAIAFAVSGRYDAAPLAELIAPLVLFLPGALLTMATVDLASAEVVTGASRFIAGLLQLALLAFGIVAGAMLVGVTATRSSHAPTELLGSWAPWLGVLVFAGGTALQHSASRRSLPWLLLVLYAAWAGQLLGQALFGARLSGFVGGLVVAPLAMFIERFPSAPPALVSFLPAFWLLVPGALGLIGFTQLVGNEPTAGLTSFVDALVSIIAIALGILIGVRTLRIARGAVASARHMARSES
jgi:uncharacterized membrane protein YjjP (DUF1212 family)